MLVTALDVEPAPEGVGLVLTVENSGSERVSLRFRSGLKADFYVREDDEEVWRWSDGRMFTHALETEDVEPGETVEYTAEWNSPGPGSYTAVASLEAEQTRLEERTKFTVENR